MIVEFLFVWFITIFYLVWQIWTILLILTQKTNDTVFQQDGAKPHTARSVTQWLRDCEVHFIHDWPGNSPDLNLIENLYMADHQERSTVKRFILCTKTWEGDQIIRGSYWATIATKHRSISSKEAQRRD